MKPAQLFESCPVVTIGHQRHVDIGPAYMMEVWGCRIRITLFGI